MKRIPVIVFLVACCGLMATAQKTINDPLAQKRTVSDFHGIRVETGIDLLLSKSSSAEVAVSASKEEFRDKIITEVKDGILILRYESKTNAINSRKEKKNLRAYVSYTSLDKLDISTGATAKWDEAISATTLDMKVSTGGVAKGAVSVGTLKISQGTGGEVHFKGKAEVLEVSGDTGSIFQGKELQVGTCHAKVSTGAGVTVAVNKELNVKASTGGYVHYTGTGGIRDVKTSTGGTVSKI